MNDPAHLQNGMDGDEAAFEHRLRLAAQGFAYPPEPDLRVAVRQRLSPLRRDRRLRLRLAIAALGLALAAAGLLAVPPVRAAIFNWLRIGAEQIWFVQPPATATTSPQSGTTATAPLVDLSTPTPPGSFLDLSGRTSLADARASAGFPIGLPAYPASLGQPDIVFFQDVGGPVVVLVWTLPGEPPRARLALSETDASNIIFQKFISQSIQQTSVNGQAAIWVEALDYGGGGVAFMRLVDRGHTLIWTAGKMTYRLETGEDLATALRIAESIKVVP